jgi:predicted transcriptional regulator
MATRGKTVQIRRFIFDNLKQHPNDIVAVVAKRFQITRQAVNAHLKDLEQVGAIEGDGNTRSRTYRLKAIADISLLKQVSGLEEHIVWRDDIAPHLSGAKENVINISH